MRSLSGICTASDQPTTQAVCCLQVRAVARTTEPACTLTSESRPTVQLSRFWLGFGLRRSWVFTDDSFRRSQFRQCDPGQGKAEHSSAACLTLFSVLPTAALFPAHPLKGVGTEVKKWSEGCGAWYYVYSVTSTCSSHAYFLLWHILVRKMKRRHFATRFRKMKRYPILLNA